VRFPIVSFLSVLVLAPGFTTGAQSTPPSREYVRENWTVADGLPINTITSIVQTRDGYLWLGTEDQQTLLLCWALATSAHTAGDKIGESTITGAELCNSDAWTAAECSSAKSMVLAAAKAAGYTADSPAR
jgi:hypothetical protein